MRLSNGNIVLNFLVELEPHGVLTRRVIRPRTNVLPQAAHVNSRIPWRMHGEGSVPGKNMLQPPKDQDRFGVRRKHGAN
jgi:hypothetical protein